MKFEPDLNVKKFGDLNNCQFFLHPATDPSNSSKTINTLAIKAIDNRAAKPCAVLLLKQKTGTSEQYYPNIQHVNPEKTVFAFPDSSVLKPCTDFSTWESDFQAIYNKNIALIFTNEPNANFYLFVKAQTYYGHQELIIDLKNGNMHENNPFLNVPFAIVTSWDIYPSETVRDANTKYSFPN